MSTTKGPNSWLLDSGAYASMSSHQNILRNFRHLKISKTVSVADGRELAVTGEGTIILQLSGKCTIEIPVLYIPGLDTQLIAVNSLTDLGFSVTFRNAVCDIHDSTGHAVAHLQRSPDLTFTLKSNSVQSYPCAAVRSQRVSIHELHQRMGHTSYHLLRKMIADNYFSDLQIADDGTSTCLACSTCKSAAVPHDRFASRTPRAVGDIVSVDLLDIHAHSSIDGHKYACLIVDHFSYMTSVMPLHTKDAPNVLGHIKGFLSIIENQTGRKARILRSDQGTEFLNDRIRTYTHANGIIHEFANVREPADNGFVERRIRTLVEHARASITQAGLPTTYWSRALSYTVYIQNKTGRRPFNYRTPHERFFGVKPSYSHLATFGQICFPLRRQPDKFAPVAVPAIFLGYEPNIQGYLVETIDNRELLVTRHVNFPTLQFIDTFSLALGGTTIVQNDTNIIPAIETTTIGAVEEDNVDATTNQVVPQEETTVLPVEEGNADSPGEQIDGTELLPRQAKAQALRNIQAMSVQISYQKTLKGEMAPLYQEARSKEWLSLVELNAFEVIDRPAHCKPIPSHFVHSVKTHADGSFASVKARLVANGNEQVEGQDFHATYAPTPSPELLRLFLTIAANKDWEVHQADVKSAYVHAPLSEELIMEVPKGISGMSGKVLRLKKALYGLKQAGNEWNRHLNACLAKDKWTVSSKEPCLFHRDNGDYLLVYVDDMMIFTPQSGGSAKVIQELNKHFPVKDLGEAHDFLGMEIRRNRSKKTFRLRQLGLVTETLQFAQAQTTVSNIPLHPAAEIYDSSEPLTAFEHKQYRGVVGKLLYIARLTRPDLSTSVNLLGRFLQSPTKTQLARLMSVVSYLNGTKEMYLELRGDIEPTIKAYSDADWAGDKRDRKSTSGHVIFYRNAAIGWASRKQKCTAGSTLESEYVSMAEAAREAYYYKRLAEEIEQVTINATLFCDNIAAQTVANGESNSSTRGAKHIDIKYHIVRELNQTKDIGIQRVESKLNRADIFTKPLSLPLFRDHRNAIGLVA